MAKQQPRQQPPLFVAELEASVPVRGGVGGRPVLEMYGEPAPAAAAGGRGAAAAERRQEKQVRAKPGLRPEVAADGRDAGEERREGGGIAGAPWTEANPWPYHGPQPEGSEDDGPRATVFPRRASPRAAEMTGGEKAGDGRREGAEETAWSGILEAREYTAYCPPAEREEEDSYEGVDQGGDRSYRPYRPPPSPPPCSPQTASPRAAGSSHRISWGPPTADPPEPPPPPQHKGNAPPLPPRRAPLPTGFGAGPRNAVPFPPPPKKTAPRPRAGVGAARPGRVLLGGSSSARRWLGRTGQALESKLEAARKQQGA